MSTLLKPKDNEECLVDLLLDDEPIHLNRALLEADNTDKTLSLINSDSSSDEDLFYVRSKNDNGGFLRGVVSWDSSICFRMIFFIISVFTIIAVLMYKSYKSKTNISGGSSSTWSFSLNAWSPVDATYSSKWSKIG